MMKVIIVGGGITGASLALTISFFSQGKVRVSLIENSLPHKPYAGFDARTIALAYGTCQQLNQIGIWHGLKKYVTPITNIHISEYGRFGIVNMYAKDYSLPALGYVIELYNMRNYFFEQLKKTPNVELYCPDTVISIERKIEHVSVKLTKDKILTGELLVAADGSDSLIAKASHIEWQRESYQQCAIITNIFTSEAPDGRAFERFTQYGPLAILPMSKERSSLVWCYPLEKKNYIMHLSNNQFMEELQKWFGWRLGEIKFVTKRYCFPLFISQAKRSISHRLVLIGNAAQTLHPIAGQGFNLGMRDVTVLANIISEASNHGNDIGDYSILMRYQMQRNNDRYNTIKLTNDLVYYFTNNHLVFTIGRNIGLMIMEILPFIRDILAHRAMGRSFHL